MNKFLGKHKQLHMMWKKKCLISLVILKNTEISAQGCRSVVQCLATMLQIQVLGLWHHKNKPKQNLKFKLGNFIYWTAKIRITDQTHY